jgi:hydrogenase maturation protein HypF
MTSGNYSDEPIVKDNGEARARLAGLADAFLLHDREIHARCDDSVIRVFEGKDLPIRRSRGYAPFPVKLPMNLPATLAVGGELKATFCLARGDHAFMSQHIGDMENLETLDAFEQAAEHFKAIFRVQPERLVSDMHPRYLSSRWAAEHAGALQHVRVQHHHAHIAAVMAEHGLDGRLPVIGFSFDGTGYGADGAIWGGEVLLADYRGFRRLAHLAYVPLPGGDAAIKRPYRTALAHLWAAGVPWTPGLPPVDACPEAERRVLLRQLVTGINTASTSSMGRLFDAVAALAGIRQTVTYEAQAAIEMEAVAEVVSEEWRVKSGGNRKRRGRRYEFAIPAALGDNGPVVFEAAPVIQAVAEDVQAQTPVAVISTRFHAAVADVILDLAMLARQHSGLAMVALSGGVFQNVTLVAAATRQLRAAGFEVLTHRLVPPNDGGLALGQAIIGGLV